jgi:hypothetical protein
VLLVALGGDRLLLSHSRVGTQYDCPAKRSTRVKTRLQLDGRVTLAGLA